MKSQSDKITLLVVREADRPVRQLQISKPLAIALPAAAVLSLSSMITSMHYHATRSMQDLEAEAAALSARNIRLEAQVADKEQTLQQVQSEAAGLSKEAEAVRERMKSVEALEHKLQDYLEKQQGGASKTSAGSAAAGTQTGLRAVPLPEEKESTAPAATKAPFLADVRTPSPSAITIRIGMLQAAIEHTPSLRVGGEYVAVYDNPEARAVSETKDDLAEIGSMLEDMIRSLTQTAEKAEQWDATRLEQALRQKEQAFLWPTSSHTISSSFGYRTDPFEGSSAFHAGIDIAAETGDFVFAAQKGTVVTVDRTSARGEYIVIDHGGGLQTWYMHLSAQNVSVGDKVAKGQRIGRVGSTGRSTGPHLHFQVVKQDTTVDPLDYVQPD